ncbi:hypothetical protein FHW69_003812 [Luteibacter sp. Sphag1AF]|uniref:hypothetical protein n=1 Tax=Luteibacter sp. Sphag1AF TaxID=2587031 RepID=UPI0016142273|nr:hypothetical protein [Luteibacter sp. Sphag1AF]MBB3229158.1 hypothetical protein [Luteibacter sp. Sphag1AF]
MTSLAAVSIARYRVDIRERMLRHKQALAAVILLLVPSLPALKALVIGPLAAVFLAPGTATSVLAASGFIGITVAWVHLQRDAVFDGVAEPLIMTLPFTRAQVLLSDLAVIGLASSPWLFLLVLSCAVSAPDVNALRAVSMCADLLCAALVAQLGWVRGRYGWTLASGCVAILSAWAGTTAATVVSTASLIALGAVLPPRRRDMFVLRRSWRIAPWRIRNDWLSLYTRELSHASHGGYRRSLPSVVFFAALSACFLLVGMPSAAGRVGLVVVYVGVAAMFSAGGFATLLKGAYEHAVFLDAIPTSVRWREAAMIAAVYWAQFLLAGILGVLAVVGNPGAWPALCTPPALAILGGMQLLVFRRSPRDAVAATIATSCLFIGIGLWLARGMS